MKTVTERIGSFLEEDGWHVIAEEAVDKEKHPELATVYYAGYEYDRSSLPLLKSYPKHYYHVILSFPEDEPPVIEEMSKGMIKKMTDRFHYLQVYSITSALREGRRMLQISLIECEC